MIQRLGPLALALVFAALFAAGCGDDNKSDSSNDSSTPAATATDSSSSDDSGGAVADNPQVQAAVAACKSSIEQNPAVKDDIKADLQAICEKAASGNPDDVKAAIKEVCVKVVESSVPGGSAQDQAKAACEQAGG